MTWESAYLGKAVFVLRRDTPHLVAVTYMTIHSISDNNVKIRPNAESALLTHILSNYDARVRPRHNSSDAVQLDLAVRIKDVENVVGGLRALYM